MPVSSPPAKRIKLEIDSDDEAEIFKPALPPKQPSNLTKADEHSDEDEELGEHCSICLQPISDRTVIPACSHEFCFECLLIWTEQSRTCPLCTGPIGEYVIHKIRSKHDFQKHYLTPLRTSPKPNASLVRAQARRRREVQWGRTQRQERERQQRAADELERAIEKRRWVYRHHLYAKHVASNPYTRYKPFPTPSQFAGNQDLISRATIFVRRELQVWDSLDVEFLTTFTISVMKSLDIRSEPAVKLLAEFLDMDSETPRANAEQFAHELYSYLRSPYRDLSMYDSLVQYDTPVDTSPPRRWDRENRWISISPSAKRTPSPKAGPSRRTSSPRISQRSQSQDRDNSIRRKRHSSSSPDRSSRERSAAPRRDSQPPPQPTRGRTGPPRSPPVSKSRSRSQPRTRDPDPPLDTKAKGKQRAAAPQANAQPVSDTPRALEPRRVPITGDEAPPVATREACDGVKEEAPAPMGLSIRGAARRQHQPPPKQSLEQRLAPPHKDNAAQARRTGGATLPSPADGGPLAGAGRTSLLERLRAEKALATEARAGVMSVDKGGGAAAQQRRDAEMLEARLRARLAGKVAPKPQEDNSVRNGAGEDN